jgi:hypothetical protein
VRHLNVLILNKVERKVNYLKETVNFWGHNKIIGTHRTTFEITKEDILSEKGDCIIGVSSNKSGLDFNDSFKKILRCNETLVKITISVANYTSLIQAKGHKDLTILSSKDLVVRKSSFICPRTLAINADKAAVDIPRRIISKLENPKIKGTMTITLIP